MPIVKCKASKATPAKGINYILDPEKMIVYGSQYMASNDPAAMANQMLQTMHLHGKGYDPDERKYYHAKVSFDPGDRPENGGTLTKEKAAAFAAEYAAKTWPGREVVWAVQDHGEAIHIHFIVAACEIDTGKKLDARDAEYRAWKDRAQDLAGEMGLSTLDWRKATKDRRESERQSNLPIDETFAEGGIKARGGQTWKDDLRSRIDDALVFANSLEEFKAALKEDGVELTRCTENTICYRLKGREKGCRGDKLGGDYTAQAIRAAIEANAKGFELQPSEDGKRPALAAMIGSADRRQVAQASGGQVITKAQREGYRELGRMAGLKRSEIDAMCDQAEKATWEEKQAAWNDYKEAKDVFWDEYKIRQQQLKNEISEAYKQRKKAKNAEWALSYRNRRRTLIGAIYAKIVLAKTGSSFKLDWEIENLKAAQQRLRKEMETFKADSGEAVETLREKGLSLDDYMDAVLRMQDAADKVFEENAALDPVAKDRLRQQAQQKQNFR